jgi:hypothetical protein
MSRILLKTEDHSRDSAGMRHVYPVISRRAGGVSVGINLNPNNACNWRCIYCQVPDLTRGGPPPLDLALLERELDGFLRAAVAGDFMATRVPAGSRRLVDLAFSGNGEPTSAREFPAAVEIAARVKGCARPRARRPPAPDHQRQPARPHSRPVRHRSCWADAGAKSGSSSMPARRRGWPASTARGPGPGRSRDAWRAARNWRRPGCRAVSS